MNGSQMENLESLIHLLGQNLHMKKELNAALPLTVNAFHKTEMEYHGKLGHTLGRIQHIDHMSIIELCYATRRLSTQIVAHTIPGFQGIKRCVQYPDSHSQKLYLSF